MIIKNNIVYLSINKKKLKVMSEFEENNPEQLKKFVSELTDLIDKYHPNIYLLDDVFVGVNQIYKTIREEINKERKV
jgi:Holliday junction resolvasome RuvABC endonuclease subunit